MPKSTFDQREQNVDQQQNADQIYNVSSLEKDPFEHEEIIHNATGAAKALYWLGIYGMVGAFVSFLGGFILGASVDTSLGILIPLAFPILFIGMVFYGIGYSMARNQAYKRRVQSRRK